MICKTFEFLNFIRNFLQVPSIKLLSNIYIIRGTMELSYEIVSTSCLLFSRESSIVDFRLGCK